MPPTHSNQPSRTRSVPTRPPSSRPSGASAIPDVQAALAKLQHENHSLKRRLVQYASTLEQLTSHAKREIAASARARDDAIAAAADAAALRQTVADVSASRDRADRSARDAHSALADKTAALTRTSDELSVLRSKVSELEADRSALREARDAVSSAERRVSKADADARAHSDRAVAAESRAHEAVERARAAEKLSREFADVARHRDDLAEKADRARREVSAAEQRDSHAKAHISRLNADVERLQNELETARSSMDERSREVAVAEERSKLSEKEIAASKEKHADDLQKAEETAAALREELDEVHKELADRSAQLSNTQSEATRDFEPSEAVEERDVLRMSVRDLQEELEQSSEMLTRAAIDALGDKSRIRKLEDALAKARDELAGERHERTSREGKIASLSEEIGTFERQLDSLRESKRALSDECHRYQMQIHEKDNLLVTKVKELEDVGTERNDRAFHVDRLSLDLSNAQNALTKKETDLVSLTTEYDEINEQVKTLSKDLEDRHLEVGHFRRELAKTSENLTSVTQEKERIETVLHEHQSARREAQDLKSTIAEKEEELDTIKRWYATLKTESSEATREKKRLTDMLSKATADLERANHEIELLRGVRKEQEALAARIAHIGETSSRELNMLKQTQSEQAERLARSTVEEYQRRLEEIQVMAKEEIATTVTEQLRHDIMPHLMRVVDAKAKGMVHALARHVESFALDDGERSYGSSRRNFSPSRDADDGENDSSSNAADTNVATASRSSAGIAQPSSVAGSESQYRSGGLSYGPSGAPASTADSRWNSMLDASRVESVEEGSLGGEAPASGEGLASPEASIGRSAGLTDLETPPEGRSEEVEDDSGAPVASRSLCEPVDTSDGTPVDEHITEELGESGSTEVDPDTAPEAVESVANETVESEDIIESGGTATTSERANELPSGEEGVLEGDEVPLETSRGLPGNDNDVNELGGVVDNTAEEEVVEELDITQPIEAEDDDDDEEHVGVDIEVEFDPRDLMSQGLFSAVVGNMQIVEEHVIDEDYEEGEEDDFDEEEEGVDREYSVEDDEEQYENDNYSDSHQGRVDDEGGVTSEGRYTENGEDEQEGLDSSSRGFTQDSSFGPEDGEDLSRGEDIGHEDSTNYGDEEAELADSRHGASMDGSGVDFDESMATSEAGLGLSMGDSIATSDVGLGEGEDSMVASEGVGVSAEDSVATNEGTEPGMEEHEGEYGEGDGEEEGDFDDRPTEDTGDRYGPLHEDEYQEMSPELQQVYQTYYMSGQGSSLGGSVPPAALYGIGRGAGGGRNAASTAKVAAAAGAAAAAAAAANAPPSSAALGGTSADAAHEVDGAGMIHEGEDRQDVGGEGYSEGHGPDDNAEFDDEEFDEGDEMLDEEAYDEYDEDGQPLEAVEGMERSETGVTNTSVGTVGNGEGRVDGLMEPRSDYGEGEDEGDGDGEDDDDDDDDYGEDEMVDDDEFDEDDGTVHTNPGSDASDMATHPYSDGEVTLGTGVTGVAGVVDASTE